MPRAKRGFKARRRRNKIMKAAKGYVEGRRRLYRLALETVRRGWRYQTRDRRRIKRDFRRLWIVRINAAARECGVSYSRFVGWLKNANVDLDRKVLADLAARDFGAFKKVVEAVRPAWRSFRGPHPPRAAPIASAEHHLLQEQSRSVLDGISSAHLDQTRR